MPPTRPASAKAWTKPQAGCLWRRAEATANKAAIASGELTTDSASEQKGAGLDRLSAAEFETFHDLNRAYRERFGFPFVICVRLHDKAGILAALKARTLIDGDELAEALRNILLIVRFRLADVLK